MVPPLAGVPAAGSEPYRAVPYLASSELEFSALPDDVLAVVLPLPPPLFLLLPPHAAINSATAPTSRHIIRGRPSVRPLLLICTAS